jgi:sugar diacid utilization regulator
MTALPLFLEDASSDDLRGFYEAVVGAFDDIAQLTASGEFDLDEVLRLIGKRMCELIGVSRCSVYLRVDDGRLQGRVGYCVGHRNIDAGIRKLIAGVRGDLFTKEILQTSAPLLVQDAARDPRTVQETMRTWGIQDLLGVPLVVGDKVIGIIYLDNQGDHHEYTARDMKLAQAFATLSALAVHQSSLHTQVAERSKTIDRQRRALGQSTLVHNRVVRSVLNGVDMHAVVKLIAELLAKPVVLRGPRLEALDWSAPPSLKIVDNPGLNTDQINLPWVRRAIAELRDGRPSVMLPKALGVRHRRLFVRMVVDHQCVGYLELCEVGQSFSTADPMALEQAAMAVALKIIASDRRREARQTETEEYLADILYGRRDLASLHSRAESFGVHLDRAHALLRVQYSDDKQQTTLASRERRGGILIHLTELSPAGLDLKASTGEPGADLFLIEHDPGARQLALLKRRLQDEIGTVAAKFNISFVLISDSCHSFDGLPAAASKLQDVGALLSETREPRIYLAREFEAARLIAHRDGIRGAMRDAEELFKPLLDYDAVHGAALMETLQAYLASQAQFRTTATMLNVHENTVRYRLGRIREISTIDPDRLDSLLHASMALQVLAASPS